MKIRKVILNKTDYINSSVDVDYVHEEQTDFYDRWYAKFGEPQWITLPADEFLARMKEMIDFE